MYRIVYKNDLNRVLLLGSKTEKECAEWLESKNLNKDDYIIEETGNGSDRVTTKTNACHLL